MISYCLRVYVKDKDRNKSYNVDCQTLEEAIGIQKFVASCPYLNLIKIESIDVEES